MLGEGRSRSKRAGGLRQLSRELDIMRKTHLCALALALVATMWADRPALSAQSAAPLPMIEFNSSDSWDIEHRESDAVIAAAESATITERAGWVRLNRVFEDFSCGSRHARQEALGPLW
jgi:hypothetical protein